MGGKSGGPKPPAVVEPPAPAFDPSAMMAMFAQMMSMQSSQPPILPEEPDVIEDPVIDWKDKLEELGRKTAADYKDDQSKKHGRADTIATSPLLDEELGEDSLLAG